MRSAQNSQDPARRGRAAAGDRVAPGHARDPRERAERDPEREEPRGAEERPAERARRPLARRDGEPVEEVVEAVVGGAREEELQAALRAPREQRVRHQESRRVIAMGFMRRLASWGRARG